MTTCYAPYSGYRWRAGTYASLDETYAVELFTRQTDMVDSVKWTRPADGAGIVTPAEIVPAQDGGQSENGGAQFTWVWTYLSSEMIKYLRDTFFGGTAYDGLQTVRLQNRLTFAWETYNATALWPTAEIIRGLATTQGGLADFPIRFIKGTKV